jgi:phospholipid transport system transporter-binding protein
VALTPISLPERVTMAEARATLLRLQPLLAMADEPVIDASALQDLDTAAVALLLDCQRQAHARGKTLRVTGAPPKLGQLAGLYGVQSLLGL